MNEPPSLTTKAAPALSLRVAQFRPITEATIDIDSITVLSGINACGKSSIARLVHALVNFNADYARELLRFETDKIQSVIGTFLELLKNTPTFVRTPTTFSASDSLDSVVEETTQWIESILEGWENIANDASLTRFVRVFLRDIGYPGIVASRGELAEFVRKKFAEVKKEYAGLSQQRTLFPFQQHHAFSALFGKNVGSTVSLLEYGEEVYHSEQTNPRKISVTQPMKELMGVKKAIYITSPLVNTPTRPERNGTVSIDDGFSFQRKAPPTLDNFLFSVLRGTIEPSTTGAGFEYQRDDGHSPFEWNDLATGIKSLAILNVLYTNGCLDSKTLLIIDEPEVHLHPQWVFEYARILSLLAKNLQVRILIATHSPEMVESLKAIAEAEQISGVRFYVADEVAEDKPYMYKFRNLEMNVEPIFKKFNVALDRMDTYEPTAQ